MVARRWIRERLGDCHDIDDLCMLNLFAGSSVLTDAVLQAGATLIHVDSVTDMPGQSRCNPGERTIRCHSLSG